MVTRVLLKYRPDEHELVELIQRQAQVFGEEGRHEPDLCKKGRCTPSDSAPAYAATAAVLEQGRRLLSGNTRWAR